MIGNVLRAEGEERSKEIVESPRFNKCGNKECIEHIPDSNFWHYSLQLNTYKHLIEKNYGTEFQESQLKRSWILVELI